jgi:hypothetical protein
VAVDGSARFIFHLSNSALKRKFLHDLQGAIDHGFDGLAFITNQNLTLSQRAALSKLGLERNKEID